MTMAKNEDDLSTVAKYFAGYTKKGQIKWRKKESKAEPLFYDYFNKYEKMYFWNDGTLQNILDSRDEISNGNVIRINPMMGDISMTWNKDLNIWMMTYDTHPVKNKNGQP